MKEHKLWILKYRVTSIDEYICKEELRTKLKQYFKENSIPHLLFVGVAGVGKTTLAKLITHNLDCDSLFLNCSDENGIETIREKVKSFASSASFKPLKVIILDEAGGLTAEAQAALYNIIEEYSLNTRFILTTNYKEKITPPLQSRCEYYQIDPPTKGEVAKFVSQNILDKEGVKYDLKDVAKIINVSYPDIRSIVKNLQRCTVDNVLEYNEDNIFEEYNFKILEILKKPSYESWKQIRQLIADAGLDDYQIVYRFLFDHLEQFAKGWEADITITLDEYSWRSRVVPDKEINMAACFAAILQIIQKPKIIKG